MDFLLAAPNSVAPRTVRPTVGVAITAYQVAHFLRDAVRSVLMQSDLPDRIVVVDDGSTDDVVGSLRGMHDHVELIRQENRGAAAAKDHAVRACETDYVILMDGDDTWERDRVHALRQTAMSRPDLHLITTDAYVEIEGRRDHQTYYQQANFRIDITNPRYSILHNNFLFSHVMIERSAWESIGGFDRRFTNVEDRRCWTRMIFAGACPGILMQPLATYRRHHGNASNRRRPMTYWRLEYFQQVLREEDLSPEERRLAETMKMTCLRTLRLLDAREAVLESSPDARSRCLEIARSPAFPAMVRLKAAMAGVSPKAARRLRKRRAFVKS